MILNPLNEIRKGQMLRQDQIAFVTKMGMRNQLPYVARSICPVLEPACHRVSAVVKTDEDIGAVQEVITVLPLAMMDNFYHNDTQGFQVRV
ncbi:MAG: hypothetical protein D6694_13745 [Gammaproteobacteria bacterium]|nr:MAG: hypothetical protein D6694_13745 [Gammaproteobacteria bacterium]